MRFMVVTDNLSFHRLPATIEAPPAKQTNREDGAPYQRNLFDSTAEDDLNGLENKVMRFKVVDEGEWEQQLNAVMGA